jgi:hypothetical protein
MKKQYIMAALLLIGFGIISTMAFTINTDLSLGTTVYDVQDSGSTGTISKAKVVPYQTLDGMKIRLTTTSPTSGNYNITITTDVDLTGCTITDSESSYISDESDLANGYLVFYNIDNSVNRFNVTITGYTPNPDSLWKDMTSLVFTMTDLA